MNAITQEINLNLIPGAIPPRINVSQYDDNSRTLSFSLYNGVTAFRPGYGATAQIQGTKPDGKGFQYDATIDETTVTATITKQMAAVAGDVRCELVLFYNTKVIGTGNFILAVEKAALGEDTDISETVLPDIIDAAESNAERAEAAAEVAESASLHPPYIGENDHWYTFDTVQEQYVDSGVDARGDDGTSIANIAKTGSAGLVDTYTVTLTDGTTYTFTVTNGADGTDGQDGADGEDGVGIASIEKTSTVGLVDTYTITLTNQTTYTFTVTNGTSAIPGGGTTGQVLTKLSNISGDAGWQTPTSGSSSLADLTDTTISTPTAAQPLTYDNASSKWVNGGVIPTANGGTGNADGYIRTGHKANTTIGTGATIEGLDNEASANYTHAEGSNTKATVAYAHAEGSSTQATGNSSHAEGNGSKATGTASHAENTSNTASGNNSHAGGNNSTSGGTYSFAHGRDISIGTNGQYAAGFGQGTVANYNHQFVAGKYNDNKSTSILEVGIGTGTNARSNGLELDTSGNLKTAGTITNGKGVVVGDADVLLPSTVGWTGKNLLQNSAEGTTKNGLTFIVNADKSVSVYGTASAKTTFKIADITTSMIPQGNYLLSGSIGGASNTYKLMYTDNSSQSVSNLDGDTPMTIYTTGYPALYIEIANGANVGTVDNPTMFYPMIRDARITDSTYEPYHKSVEECLEEINDKLSYLEQSVTLSTSASTTVTFTDSSITANSFIEYACSQWDLVPESITGAAGSCTIVLPKVDSAQSVTVRIYVR